MKEISLNTLFSSLQMAMIQEARFSDTLDHPTDKGDNTEECWINWFNRYLPKRYCADKATIIDCNGNMSEQIDIVLYDRHYSYLVFNQNSIKYLPAESVYAVFEVKPSMNKAYIEYAGKKAESVRKLHRTSTAIPYANGTYNPKEPQRIIAGILSTKSDWKTPFGDPFKKVISTLEEQEQIDIGCSLENGAFHYNYRQSLLRTSKESESLVWFFLELLIELRKMGTVPAIDLAAYMQSLCTDEVKT